MRQCLENISESGDVKRDLKNAKNGSHRPYFFSKYRMDNGNTKYEHSSLGLILRIETAIPFGIVYFFYRKTIKSINEGFGVSLPKRFKVIDGFYEHKFNPLHLYCRLIDFGLSKENALKKASFYEFKFFKPFIINGDPKKF